jgi:hypothetical protein
MTGDPCWGSCQNGSKCRRICSRSRLDRAAGTVANVVQSDGIAFDGKQDTKDAGAAAIKHLMQGDAELLGFVLGDRVPLG